MKRTRSKNLFATRRARQTPQRPRASFFPDSLSTHRALALAHARCVHLAPWHETHRSVARRTRASADQLQPVYHQTHLLGLERDPARLRQEHLEESERVQEAADGGDEVEVLLNAHERDVTCAIVKFACARVVVLNVGLLDRDRSRFVQASIESLGTYPSICRTANPAPLMCRRLERRTHPPLGRNSEQLAAVPNAANVHSDMSHLQHERHQAPTRHSHI
jgi:hypothetical protein